MQGRDEIADVRVCAGSSAAASVAACLLSRFLRSDAAAATRRGRERATRGRCARGQGRQLTTPTAQHTSDRARLL